MEFLIKPKLKKKDIKEQNMIYGYEYQNTCPGIICYEKGCPGIKCYEKV